MFFFSVCVKLLYIYCICICLIICEVCHTVNFVGSLLEDQASFFVIGIFRGILFWITVDYSLDTWSCNAARHWCSRRCTNVLKWTLIKWNSFHLIYCRQVIAIAIRPFGRKPSTLSLDRYVCMCVKQKEFNEIQCKIG